MIRVPVDAVWVGRMAELAGGPWTEEAIAAKFTEYGWVPQDDGMPAPWWGPELGDIFGKDDEGRQSGWIMAFEEPPPSETDPDRKELWPESRMMLFCGWFWPAFGEEDTGSRDRVDNPDYLFEDAEDYRAFIVEPEARRADFVAEFDRVKALVQDVLGEPTRTVSEDGWKIRAIWDRGVMALVLCIQDNTWEYSTDDMLVLSIEPHESAAVFT